MQNLNKGSADIRNSIDSRLFERELVPIFEKMTITVDVPFYIPSMSDINEYDSLFYNIFHGIVYNFFLKIEKKERLTYDEYKYLYDSCIKVDVFNGEKTVYYGFSPIIVISNYNEKETDRICEYITPIYENKIKRVVNKRTTILMPSEEEDKNKMKDILDKSKDFISSERKLDFDDFD